MVRKEDNETLNHNFLLISIVAIVAVMGVFVVMLSPRDAAFSEQSTIFMAEEFQEDILDSDLAGMAFLEEGNSVQDDGAIFVYRMFRIMLDRSHQAIENNCDGFNFWGDKLNSGEITKKQISDRFNTQYHGKDVTDEIFVKRLYQVLLNRDPEPNAIKTRVGALRNARSISDATWVRKKWDMYNGVMGSAEYRNDPELHSENVPCVVSTPPLVTGCYLDIVSNVDSMLASSQDEVFIGESLEDCKSYAFANKYADKLDFLRLVLKNNLNKKDKLDYELGSISSNKDYVIKYKDYSTTTKKGGPKTTILTAQTRSDKCELVYFFGVELFCFNEVIDSEKSDNLKSVIAPLTFLMIAGNSNSSNTILMKHIEPFDFLKEEKIVFVDGTNMGALKAINMYYLTDTDPNIRCKEEGYEGAANFQWRNKLSKRHEVVEAYTTEERDSGTIYLRPPPASAKFVTFFCRFDGFEKRISYSGILYHEGNHKFQGGHKKNGCNRGSHGGDCGWRSVFGAHVNYLYDASQNDFLTCSERKQLYRELEKVLIRVTIGVKDPPPAIQDLKEPVCS
ncbi:hypothetical protein ACFL0W_02710 [Nanoarchaeota archaeon]